MFARLLALLALAIASNAWAALPTNWDWSSPSPHRQGWRDIAAGPKGFVGITDGLGGRDLYFSADGATWQRAQAPRTQGLLRVTFANGLYIAVGNRETVLSSKDGIDWQLRHENAGGTSFLDMAYGNGRFVAVGYGPSTFLTTDLENWTEISSGGAGYSLSEVEFGNGVFFAYGGKALRSTDGVNWQEVKSSAQAFSSIDWGTGLAFGGGKFLLSTTMGSAVSADGLNWSDATPLWFSRIVGAAFGFLAIGAQGLQRSADGVNWNADLANPGVTAGSPRITCAAVLGARTVAAGDAGMLFTTSSGGWKPLVGDVDYSRAKLATGNGLFIRYGEVAGNYSSLDGLSWRFNGTAPGLTSLAGGNNVWVGVTADNLAAVSSDAATWLETALPGQAYGDILFANGTFLVATEGGVLVSTDGKAWTKGSIAGASSVRLIGFQNGTFAAITDSGATATSSDGVNWAAHATNANAQAQFYAAGNGRFIGVRGGGMGPGSVLSSTDGVNWQVQTLSSGVTHTYVSLSFGGGAFIMTDNYGEVAYSTDGVNWTGERQAPQAFSAAAFQNGIWMLLGGDSILVSSGQISATALSATLQLTQASAGVWSLVVSGTAGATFSIETAASVNGPWGNATSVQIPVSGRATVPVTLNASSAYFKATSL